MCSSLTTETLVVSDGVDSAVYISVLLSELYPELNSFEIQIDIYIYILIINQYMMLPTQKNMLVKNNLVLILEH